MNFHFITYRPYSDKNHKDDLDRYEYFLSFAIFLRFTFWRKVDAFYFVKARLCLGLGWCFRYFSFTQKNTLPKAIWKAVYESNAFLIYGEKMWLPS